MSTAYSLEKSLIQGRFKAEGEESDRGWDSGTASPMQWTWTWANFGRWWRTGRPGVLQSMGSQRVGHNWTTEQHVTCIKNQLIYEWLFQSFFHLNKAIDEIIWCFILPQVEKVVRIGRKLSILFFYHWQDLLMVCLHMAGSWAGCPCFLGATMSLNNLD